MGKSIWTTSGHYVFVREVTKDHIHIYDPWNSGGKYETTTRAEWEQYVKYLFLIKKPIKYIKTTKNCHKRKAPKALARTKSLGKFKKGQRLAVDKVQGKFYHIMGHDCWVYNVNTKVCK